MKVRPYIIQVAPFVNVAVGLSLIILPFLIGGVSASTAAFTAVGVAWLGMAVYLDAILNTQQSATYRRILALKSIFRSLATKKREYFVHELEEMEGGVFTQYVAAPQQQLEDTFAIILEAAEAQFSTVSIPHFWSLRNMGGSALKRYVELNTKLALRGGAVERYIVVDYNTISSSIPCHLRACLAELKEAEEEFNRHPARGSLKNYVIWLSELPRDTWDRNRNFAIWEDRDQQKWLVDMEHRVRQDNAVVFASIRIQRCVPTEQRTAQRLQDLKNCRNIVWTNPDKFSIAKRFPQLRERRLPALGNVEFAGEPAFNASMVDATDRGIGVRFSRATPFEEEQVVTVIPPSAYAGRYRVAWKDPIEEIGRCGLKRIGPAASPELAEAPGA